MKPKDFSHTNPSYFRRPFQWLLLRYTDEKFTGYLTLTCSFSSCYQNSPQANYFRVYRRLKRVDMSVQWLPCIKVARTSQSSGKRGFYFPLLNSLFSIKILIIVNSRLVNISLLRISAQPPAKATETNSARHYKPSMLRTRLPQGIHS